MEFLTMTTTLIRSTLFAAGAAAMLVAGPAAADQWNVVEEESTLGVVATQLGSEFNAEFESFRGDIVFDPDALDDSHARIEIDVASFTSGSRDRDQNVTNPEWFDADSHPDAIFETSAFRETDDGYEADATLSIKGVSQEVTLPFTLDIEGDRAHMQGRLEIIRTEYNVGEGEWEDGDTVGLDVAVVVDLIATRAE
jgi:polyisoprenoid-binding protein YceI